MRVSKLNKIFSALYVLLFLSYMANADSSLDMLFKKCIKEEKRGRYLSSLRCFSKVPKDYILYPNALAYKVQIKLYKGENIEPYLDELLKYSKESALVQEVLAQIMVDYYEKGEYKKAYMIALNLDPRGIKDNIAYYLNIRRKIFAEVGDYNNLRKTERILVTQYYYTNPGLRLLKRKISRMSQREIENYINKLIRHRRYSDAASLANYITNKNKRYYYKVKALAPMRRTRSLAKKYLAKINPRSHYFGKAVYEIARRSGYRTRIRYIKLLGRYGHTYYQSKLAYGLMERYFYKGLRNRSAFSKLEYFASFVKHPDFLERKFLLLAMKEYRLGNYETAAELLARNTRYVKYKPSKYYYWLHLTYKYLDPDLSSYYLYKAASYNNPRSFYSVISKIKLNVKKTFLDVKKPMLNAPLHKKRDRRLFRILKLKHLGIYGDAYKEALYYYKSATTLAEKLKLHKVFPELTAREFARNKKYYGYSFPKPFDYITEEDLIYAIMRQESFFNTYAVSRAGARGLMQIMPATARWIAAQMGIKGIRTDDLFIPEINIRFGRFYIRYLLRRFNGNLIYAIAAYNAGPGRVKGFIKRNRIRDIAEFVEFFPFAETRDYVKKVYLNYIFYRE